MAAESTRAPVLWEFREAGETSFESVSESIVCTATRCDFSESDFVKSSRLPSYIFACYEKKVIGPSMRYLRSQYHAALVQWFYGRG